MDNLPAIRQLQYLIALAETGSFSAAAAQCHVTQSTLSAGISALETLLGHKIADRAQRRVTLTPLGEETLDKARQVVGISRAIMVRAHHMDKPLAGPLRLGVIPTIAPYILPQLLPVLRRNFKDMELRLHEDLSARLVTGLQSGALDAVLMAFPFDMAGMTQRDLFSEPFFLACPRGYWKGGRTVRTEDLADHNVLLLEDGHCLRDHALAACRLPAPGARRQFSATSLPTLISMAQSGYGVTLLPAMATRNLEKQMDIIPFRAPAPARRIGMAWRADSPRATDYESLARVIEEKYATI